MPNTKKTIRQSNNRGEILYSGSVTAVTPKTIVVFNPAHDVEIAVQRNPDASVQNASTTEVGDSDTVQTLCSKAAITLSPLPHSCHSRTSGKTFPSLMTTSLMTIWMMRKQRSMTGTTNLP